jgi:hypothetical protein
LRVTVQVLLEVPGSTEQQREAGVQTALAIIAASGIDPEFAQYGYRAREAWNLAGRPESEKLTCDEMEAAAVFALARRAAFEMCDIEFHEPVTPDHIFLIQTVLLH